MSVVARADARQLPIADGVVQCCVTSPPYWGLRDYGTARWEGGDPACDHRNGPLASPKSTLQGYTGPDVKLATGGMPFRDTCGKCGARRVDAQLGLEPTPDAYVENLVQVFRQVHRVLRDDGVCFLNLGDSFLPGKQLGMIPARVALALQADGWILRMDIVWSKANPMPESVTDRPTKAHEYVFLLTKSERYYWDAEAVKEVAVTRPQRWLGGDGEYAEKAAPPGSQRRHSVGFKQRTAEALARGDRNIRSVWSIATQPYSGAHFATMPEKLVERCVLAGSRPGDLVLDPFVGSGTVARVAISLGRKAVGCDLNRQYLALAEERTTVTRGLPLEWDEEAV